MSADRTIGGWPISENGEPLMTLGEMKATMREESLCSTCVHAELCKTATTIESPMLAVISRCTMHLEAVEG